MFADDLSTNAQATGNDMSLWARGRFVSGMPEKPFLDCDDLDHASIQWPSASARRADRGNRAWNAQIVPLSLTKNIPGNGGLGHENSAQDSRHENSAKDSQQAARTRFYFDPDSGQNKFVCMLG